MWTSKKRIKFAVDFISLNLAKLRPGDLMNLRDDLNTFMGNVIGEPLDLRATGWIRAEPLESPSPKEYTEDDFRDLQNEIRYILETLVDVRDRGGGDWKRTRITAEYCIVPSFNNVNNLSVCGPTRDTVLLTLFLLLSYERNNPILRCPECKSIFYRIRKQKYCSRPCSNRVSVRRFRETEESKKREKARSKKRYKEKIEKKLGGKVVINKAEKEKK